MPDLPSKRDSPIVGPTADDSRACVHLHTSLKGAPSSVMGFGPETDMQTISPRRRCIKTLFHWMGILAIGLCSGSCGIFSNPSCPESPITIVAAPSGCGTRINANKVISWVITFTASGLDPSLEALWTFSDGSTATGAVVTHSFDTAAREATNFNTTSPTGEHVPVKLDITVTAGCQTVTKTIDVPLVGTLDGGPEPEGDICIPDEGRLHVAVGTKLCYNTNPPASGSHYSAAGIAPIAPGFQDTAVPTEAWIHNLEHGSVVLLYDCGGTCTDDFKNQLRDLFDQVPASPRFNEKKMVITPYAGTEPSCPATATFPASGQFLAISWDIQHSFSTLDVPGILAFYARHVDHGPEDLNIPSQ